jgi:hypothetical protein
VADVSTFLDPDVLTASIANTARDINPKLFDQVSSLESDISAAQASLATQRLPAAKQVMADASEKLDALAIPEGETTAQYRDRMKATQAIMDKRDADIKALGDPQAKLSSKLQALVDQHANISPTKRTSRRAAAPHPPSRTPLATRATLQFLPRGINSAPEQKLSPNPARKRERLPQHQRHKRLPYSSNVLSIRHLQRRWLRL